MRPITRTTLCAIAAAAMAAPASAAVNAYLEIGPIKGESAAKASGGKQIEILSWSWGATNAGKYGAVSGAHRDDGVAAPAEKRQHGWNTVSKPLDRGSVRVKVKLPWLDCRVGAAFPDAVLHNDAGRYDLKEVMISSCARESVALTYKKVTVRGWNPETKEP